MKTNAFQRAILAVCLFLLLTTVLCALPGCAVTGVAPAAAASAPAPSFNDQVAKAVKEITLARQAATQLLLDKKITVEQDKAFQAALDLIHDELSKAQMTSLFDPAQGAQLLADALDALAKYEQGAAK